MCTEAVSVAAPSAKCGHDVRTENHVLAGNHQCTQHDLLARDHECTQHDLLTGDDERSGDDLQSKGAGPLLASAMSADDDVCSGNHECSDDNVRPGDHECPRDDLCSEAPFADVPSSSHDVCSGHDLCPDDDLCSRDHLLVLLTAAQSMNQDDQRESGIRSGSRESEGPLSAQQARERAWRFEGRSFEGATGSCRAVLMPEYTGRVTWQSQWHPILFGTILSSRPRRLNRHLRSKGLVFPMDNSNTPGILSSPGWLAVDSADATTM